MFKMCKIIKIAFKTQVFRKKDLRKKRAEHFSLRGGSLSHTLKTPGLGDPVTISQIVNFTGDPA